MPSGKTHLVVATAASTVLTYYLHLPKEYIVAGAIGGLLPDSDHKKSLIGGIFPMWIFCKHRGFTHSWLALMAFSLCVFFMTNWYVAIVFAFGYFSHLLIDWRVPWRWPKKKRRYKKK